MRVLGALFGIAAAAAVTLGSGAASAQDRKVRMQMQSNFASTLSLLGPPGQAFDSVSSGALDAAWATPGFWTGKDIAFAVFSTVPFGPGLGEYLAWMKHGGGEQLMRQLYAKYNIHAVMCHLIPPEASGWFRKEIKNAGGPQGSEEAIVRSRRQLAASCRRPS